MYHGSKSKSHQWGNWSEWGWDESRHSYYRVRQDAEGNLDYDFETNPRGSATAISHAQTPRDQTIRDITERLKDLSTDSYEATLYEGQISVDQPSTSRSAKHRSGKHKHRSSGNEKDLGQISYATSGSDPRHHSQSTHDDYEANQYVHGSSSLSSYYQQPPPSNAQSGSSYSRNNNAPGDYYGTSGSSSKREKYDSRQKEREEAELADTIAATQTLNYNSYTSPTDAATSAYVQYDEEEDDGPPTPRAQSAQDGYHIAGFEDALEELDPRYRVEPSNRFQPGEIFKVHWSEPQGSANDGAPSVSGKHEIQNRFGTKFFVGFRRFIVVANDQGHCTCVPILTYGGKGCKKKGVKADKHGIIYERGYKPRLLDKEPKLGFAPVRVDMKEEGEKLSKESRVNYSKLVTVEHNVKVFFIGSVTNSDWDYVREAVNQCWNQKNHQKQRHR